MLNKFALAALAFSLASMGAASSSIDQGSVKQGEAVASTYKGPKKRIAVMKIDGSGIGRGVYSELANIYKASTGVRTQGDLEARLTEMLTTALDSTGRFVVLERANLDDIREEMAITEELGNEKTQVKKGNLLGAQMLIRAAVTEFTPSKKSAGGGVSIGGVRLGGAQNEASVVLDVRFIDPNTSQVLYTGKAEGNSRSSGVTAGVRVGNVGLGGGQSDSQPMDRAVRNAVEKAVMLIVEKMAPLPFEARVAGVDADGSLILNRGSNDGLKVGDVLRVYTAGATILDPETGEVLGRSEDKLVGEAQVNWVNERIAKASFTGTGSPDATYILKLISK